MATASKLLVAAEAREFAGLLRRIPSQPMPWPAAFARVSGNRIFLANGAGPRSIEQLLRPGPDDRLRIDEIISVGFCGALDPALQVGDIVEPQPNEIWSEDRVVVTAAEKRALHQRTGARIVEMEYAAVEAAARRWGVPCRAIKVVSDTAEEDLPLDLNLYRDADGRFQLTRIALAGLMRPFTVLPKLMRLDRNSRIATEKLGEFLVHSKF